MDQETVGMPLTNLSSAQKAPAASPETLVDLLEHACETYRKSDALQVKRNGVYEPISSEELRESVQQAGAGLAKLGVRKGDRIALLSENRPEWAISDQGILSIGAINVPFYATLPATQIAELLLDSEASAIIVSSQLQLEKVLSIASRVSSLRQIVVMDPVRGAPQETIRFSTLREIGRAALQENRAAFEAMRQNVGAGDVASIIYTSGTTGVPKGVMLTHRNIVTNVIDSAEAFDLSASDVSLSFLPLCHIFQRMVDYLMLYQGVSIAYAESFETVPQNMQEVHPTVVSSVPRFFEKMHARIDEAMRAGPAQKQKLIAWALAVGKDYSRMVIGKEKVSSILKLKHAVADRLVFSKLRAKLGGRLRFFISGGAPLDKELADFFFSVGVMILEGYGLTETSPVIAVNRRHSFKLGTVGQALRQVEVKIAEDGEILTRGPAVMLGYYKREAETREVMAGGWFHTGDIGSLDNDGFLKITDRKKDLIVTASGKNVAPQKIEGLLKTNPYFLNVVAVGDKRPFISALVVPNADRLKAQADFMGLNSGNYPDLLRSAPLKGFLLAQIQASTRDLAPFEQVRRIQLLEHDFAIAAGELTPTMKIRRRFVETKYKDLIDQMYAG
ncbi:MAG: long-chain fatty acid--CoA ligase [Acidobacteria bacterium]|nr:long-chain fatty acid--CoA ligase [Acidobacteriota bacterium]